MAELLITLAILAEIATFTIPKVLVRQTNARYQAIAKEGAAMVSGAYQQYKNQTDVTSGAGIQYFTQYMNYVATDTSTVIDDVQNQNFYTCGASNAAFCLKLHNGSMLRYGKATTYNFGGTASTNFVWFQIDPDGTNDGTTNGPGKAVGFILYYNGRLSTYGIVNGTTQDPPWFTW